MPLYSWTLREYFDSEIETINKQDFRKAEKYWDWISKIVSRISEAGGFNITKSQLEEDIEDIFSFEWKLLKVFFLSFFFFLKIFRKKVKNKIQITHLRIFCTWV